MELTGSVQKYHWGHLGRASLVGKFAEANLNVEVNETETYAEFWMGTHPNGPSRVKPGDVTLSEHLRRHTQDLGEKVVSKFGTDLPFLFKILSINQPLSIQAHPTKSHAKKLFETYPNIYKDDNHKPEVAIAVTQFEALCGFRPLSEIKQFLREVEEFQLLIQPDKCHRFLESPDDGDGGGTALMKDCFKCLMTSSEDKVTVAAEKLVKRLESIVDREKYLYPLVKRIYSLFPNDVGIFCLYWLNYLVLSPGEALYLAPNEPHAYLYGDCIECMSNSDNVVRAGLTPKFRDVDTLCTMLSYKSYQPSEILFSPTCEDDYTQLYAPPIEDFAVAKITLPDGRDYPLKRRESGSILLVYSGRGQVDATTLDFGKVLFVPANKDVVVKSRGIVLFQAFCNI